MRAPVKRKSDRFRQLELERAKLIEYLLSDCSLTQGSYTEVLVKCGKVGCHCEDKPAHLVARLGTRRGNKAQNQVVRIADRERVRSLVDVYRKHRAALADLKDIHQQQEKTVKSIINDKDEPYS